MARTWFNAEGFAALKTKHTGAPSRPFLMKAKWQRISLPNKEQQRIDSPAHSKIFAKPRFKT